MRTKVIKKTYILRIKDGMFSYREYGDTSAVICAELVREVFVLQGARVVDMVITNAKPKSLTNRHVMRKFGTRWHVTTGPRHSDFYQLLGNASDVLSRDFPNNTRLYISAYA